MLNTTIRSASAAALAISEALTPCDGDLTPVWAQCTRDWDVCDCSACVEDRVRQARVEAQAAALDEWLATEARIAAVRCACCGEPVEWDSSAQAFAEPVSGFDVIKCGELKYTEIAHRACAQRDGEGWRPVPDGAGYRL